MAIDKTKLTGVEKVYPLNVSPYEQYMGDFKNPSVVSKVNAMIQSLHQIGRLTNETVSQWNNVMKWIVDGGMDEIAETITNEKVSVALNEVMRMLDVSLDNGLKELAENVSDKKINELLESGQFESMIQTSLVEINEVVENKLDGFNVQLAETALSINQKDYVKVLRENNQIPETFQARITGERSLECYLPLPNGKYIYYTFNKDTMDDYIKFDKGSIGSISQIDVKTGLKNFLTMTGTFVKSNYNWYASTVGSTFTFTFDGTGFDIHHYSDLRGGLWEFEVDGTIVKTISTHKNAVLASELDADAVTGKRNIIRGLTAGTHTVLATFKGDDPNNPPSDGVGTSRGWIANNSEYPTEKRDKGSTAIIYNSVDGFKEEVVILRELSNKEYALSVKKAGSTAAYNWIPEHGVGTAFAVEQKILFDGAQIPSTAYQNALSNVKQIQIIQTMNGFHPSDLVNPLVKIHSLHTITNKGVNVKGKVEFLQDTDIQSGYGLMLSVHSGFGNKLITSFNSKYASTKIDGSATVLTNEQDKINSVAFYNEGTGNANKYVVAMTINNLPQLLRYGKANRGNYGGFFYIDHRNETVQKLYPYAFNNHIAQVGEQWGYDGTYFIGELPMAKDII